ncbi:MAG: TIR domain-containing protein [bacterium]|nr:TIR domain-containing protein [bacterium]
MIISVFISHSSKDKPFAEEIKAFLESKGVKGWLDNYEIKGGAIVIERIVEAIFNSDYFIILLTQKAHESTWVRYELRQGVVRWIEDLKMDRPFVLPLLLEDCERWNGIRLLHYIDCIPYTLHEVAMREIECAIFDPARSELHVAQRAFEPNTPDVKAYNQHTLATFTEAISRYVQRSIVNSRDLAVHPILRESKSATTLKNLVIRDNRITLLGNAGSGKSMELRKLVFDLSEANSILIPVFANLNTYIEQSIDAFVPDLARFDDETVVLILDGFDEIQPKHKNSAIRQIELFAQNHEEIRIVLSCRTNLYQPIHGFQSYYLEELDDKQRHSYIRAQLGDQSTTFESLIRERDFAELLRNPFQMTQIVELFANTKSVPQRKSDLISAFIKSTLENAIAKYRTTLPEPMRNGRNIVKSLKRVALVMEAMGRNSITLEEFEMIVPDSDRQIMLKSSGLLIDSGDSSIQFTHNIFQEYLAAASLHDQSVATIKTFFAFPPTFSQLRPTWSNTIALFLGTVQNENTFSELVQWLRQSAPELLIRCEAETIDAHDRFVLFKSVFKEFRQKQIPIPLEGQYTYRDLGLFASTTDSLKYLLDIVESETDLNTLENAVRILRFAHLPYAHLSRYERAFITLLQSHKTSHHLVASTLIAMAEQRFWTKGTVELIVATFRDNSNTWIRHGLYSYLYSGPALENYFQVFLDGIKLVRRMFATEIEETRLANEPWDIRYGLSKVKTPATLKTVLAYFITNPDDFSCVFRHDTLDELIESLTSAHGDDSTIWFDVSALYLRLVNTHNEDLAVDLLAFFDVTGTRRELLNSLFTQRGTDNRWYRPIGLAIDPDSVDLIHGLYSDKIIEKNDIWVLSQCTAKKTDMAYDWFIEAMNAKSSGEFARPLPRDYEKENADRWNSDIALLFDRSAFIDAIKMLYDNVGTETLTSDVLFDLRVKANNEFEPSELVQKVLRWVLGESVLTFDEVEFRLLNIDWDTTFVAYVHEYLSHNRSVVLTPEHHAFIVHWCQEELRTVNFRSALTQDNENGRSDPNAMLIWYFVRHYSIPCPDSILLDMLSYDWFDGTSWVGIGYIEEHLDSTLISDQVLANLADGISAYTVLENHFDYCTRHNVYDAVPYAVSVVKDSQWLSRTRDRALELILKVRKDDLDLKLLVADVDDTYKWVFLTKVKDIIPRFVEDHALKLLSNRSSDAERSSAASLLLSMQKLSGLEHFAEAVQMERRAPHLIHSNLQFTSYLKRDGLENLLSMLEVTYEEGFNDGRHETFQNQLLGNLTDLAVSHNSLEKVVTGVGALIDKVSGKNTAARFLHLYLKRLERQVLEGRSLNVRITDAIAMVDSVVS